MSAVTLQMVEQLNKDAKTQNDLRLQQIGAKDAAEASFAKVVKTYADKYGVEITEANLQQEYNLAYAAMVQDYTVLNNQLISIKSGVNTPLVATSVINYEEAEKYATDNLITPVSQPTLQPVVATIADIVPLQGGQAIIEQGINFTPDISAINASDNVDVGTSNIEDIESDLADKVITTPTWGEATATATSMSGF